MANGDSANGRKVAFLHGNGSVVLPLGLLSVMVIGLLNLGVSYSKSAADSAIREALQDSAIGGLDADIEINRKNAEKDTAKVTEGIRHIKEVELLLLRQQLARIEIALKSKGIME